jgi:hypothetical protein
MAARYSASPRDRSHSDQAIFTVVPWPAPAPAPILYVKNILRIKKNILKKALTV